MLDRLRVAVQHHHSRIVAALAGRCAINPRGKS
jgi:hypothetical protein